MNESNVDAQCAEIAAKMLPVLHELTGKYDFRILAAILVKEAVVLLQAGISTGAITPSLAAQYFTAAVLRVLKPREKKATAIYTDGELIGRKN